ncbi:endonuclease [Vibrio owensii]|uniref:endonuclease n=1 Tax=Vibrio owensii TaxID=696485 RepID=UPI0018F10BF2|nr:endonuclease [Vibrio owensii]
MKASYLALPVLLLPLSTSVLSAGNTTNDSFNKAKKMLERSVYYDHRVTLYCAASFDSKKNIDLPDGFSTKKYKKRAQRLEWEHAVATEHYGQNFVEWREGHEKCINSKGKPFKGRKCAEKTNMEYRYMQSDMHSIYPSIGAVNASRSNYIFTMLPSEKSDFGSCDMRIDNKKVQPPIASRGRIARTYMYMEATYPKYRMSSQQRKLMQAWDKQDPVSKWECTRAKRIEKLQGNANVIVNSRCEAAGS